MRFTSRVLTKLFLLYIQAALPSFHNANMYSIRYEYNRYQHKLVRTLDGYRWSPSRGGWGWGYWEGSPQQGHLSSRPQQDEVCQICPYYGWGVDLRTRDRLWSEMNSYKTVSIRYLQTYSCVLLMMGSIERFVTLGIKFQVISKGPADDSAP